MKLLVHWLEFAAVLCVSVCAGSLIYPREVHLANMKQLTFGGANAEAYFSFDNQKIIFQAIDFGTQCDQIFEFDLKYGDMGKVAPRRISSGLGVCTCSFFLPDNVHMMYAGTMMAPNQTQCPEKLCRSSAVNSDAKLAHLCNNTYTWDIYPQFDIFKVNQVGSIVKQMTNSPGYDAEAVVSPNHDLIVFTSIRPNSTNGFADLELYTMDLEGNNVKQVTNELGYDGGAFFNPDGTKLIFRASRPKTPAEQQKYKTLLDYNLVAPTAMELMVVNVDGSNLRQITHLGGANWAPYYHPGGDRVIFASNHEYLTSDESHFNLYLIGEDGSNLEKVTFDAHFDSFPMFSWDGTKIIFASNRNATTGPHEMNVFIADWIETPTPPSNHSTSPNPSNHSTTLKPANHSTIAPPSTTTSSTTHLQCKPIIITLNIVIVCLLFFLKNE